MAMQNKLESIYSGGIETTIKKIDFEVYFVTQDLVEALYQSNRYPRLLEDHAAKTRRTYFTAEGAEWFNDVPLGNLLDVIFKFELVLSCMVLSLMFDSFWYELSHVL